jgi:hypothetical protein
LERVSTQNPVPLARRIDLPDFKKKPTDSAAILLRRVQASRLRFSAIFERKKQFDDLPPLLKDRLHFLASRLEWVENNIDVITKEWIPVFQRTVIFGLQAIGNINCSSLGKNFKTIAADFANVVEGGYFNVCKDKEFWDLK